MSNSFLHDPVNTVGHQADGGACCGLSRAILFVSSSPSAFLIYGGRF